MAAAVDTQMKRQRRARRYRKSWLVDAIGIGVMLACVVMLVAAAHAAPAVSQAQPAYTPAQDPCP